MRATARWPTAADGAEGPPHARRLLRGDSPHPVGRGLSARRGLFAPDQATEAFAELLRTVVDPERFPALHRAVEGGAFAPTEGPTYAPFEFGLDLILDGVERLVESPEAGRTSPRSR